MLKGKRIFISGGNGVIGNYLVEKLHTMGAILFVGDLKPRPKDWPVDIKYRQGDLNYITKGELDNFGPEIFFHLAATFERSTETYNFWYENKKHNIDLSTHLMTLLKDSSSLKRVVFASSYLIYDKLLYTFLSPQNIPTKLKESDPIFPRNLTGAAKLNHEIELNFLQEFNKNNYVITSARIYRSYGKYSRDIISRWIRSLLNGEELVVYGKESMFDYIFAEDVAEGLIRIAESNYSSHVVNLGRGKARKVSEILDILQKHFPDMKYKEESYIGVYECSEADMTMFKDTINWLPSQDLEDTIPKMIKWEKNASQEVKQEGFNILISSISKKVPLICEVKNAINKISLPIKIIGGDTNDDCIGKHFVDEFWKMPKTTIENEQEIVDYIKEKNIRAIIPTRDGELLFWANLKDKLPNVNILISNTNSIEICLDKMRFYEELSALNYPVIKTSTYIDKISSAERFVVKKRFGAGSQSLGLNLTMDEAILHGTGIKDPIFQPYIQGKEYSVDLYIDKVGCIKGIISRTRDLIVNGESQITSIVIDDELIKLSKNFVNALNLYGHVVLQVIKNKDKFYIIECNCRFGGASTISVKAGLDTFYWFLLETVGQNINEYPFILNNNVKQQIRFNQDLIL